MADIASSDVVYTLQNQAIEGGGYSKNVLKVAFGDGALTYPSGGIPLSKPKMGVPNSIRSLKILDQNDASGLVFKYDFENNKIRIYQSAGHAHDLLIKGGQAASTTNNTAHYATDILGKEAATDATIAGSASATKGGVIALAAGALVEFSGAVAAAVLYVEVVGY